MKVRKSGVHAICAAVVGGSMLVCGIAQAAGSAQQALAEDDAPRGRVEIFDVQPAATAASALRDITVGSLLNAMAAERAALAARLGQEAAALLKQGEPVIELSGKVGPHALAQAALVSSAAE